MYTDEAHVNSCILTLTPCTFLQSLTLKTISDTGNLLVILALLSSLPPTSVNEIQLSIDFSAPYSEFDLKSVPWEKFDKVFSEFSGLRKVTIAARGLEAEPFDSDFESSKATIYTVLHENLPETKRILCVEFAEDLSGCK